MITESQDFDYRTLGNSELATCLERIHPFNTWGSIEKGCIEAASRLRALTKTIASKDAEIARLREAMARIMHAEKTPPLTNMSRADMREIAGAALAQVVKP